MTKADISLDDPKIRRVTVNSEVTEVEERLTTAWFLGDSLQQIHEETMMEATKLHQSFWTPPNPTKPRGGCVLGEEHLL